MYLLAFEVVSWMVLRQLNTWSPVRAQLQTGNGANSSARNSPWKTGAQVGKWYSKPVSPSSCEKQSFLLCPSFWTSGPASFIESTEQTQERSYAQNLVLCSLTHTFYVFIQYGSPNSNFVQLGTLQAAPSEAHAGWQQAGYTLLTDGRALISNIAHLTASRIVHFSQQVSPLPPLSALQSCLQFSCAAAVASFETHWASPRRLKGVSHSGFSTGELLGRSSAAPLLPPPRVRRVGKRTDSRTLLQRTSQQLCRARRLLGHRAVPSRGALRRPRQPWCD